MQTKKNSIRTPNTLTLWLLTLTCLCFSGNSAATTAFGQWQALGSDISSSGLSATLQLSGTTDSMGGGNPGYTPVPNEMYQYVIAVNETSGNASMPFNLMIFSADVFLGSGTGAGWVCTPITGGLDCNGPVVGANGMTTLSIPVTAPPVPLQIQTNLALTPNTPDIVVGSPLTITTTSGVGLQANLVTGDTAGLAGDPLSYTFSMTNIDRAASTIDGSRAVMPLLIIDVHDGMGTPLPFTGGSGTDWSCSVVGPFVECLYSGSALDAPGMTTSSVVVNFTAPVVNSQDTITVFADPAADNIDLVPGQEANLITLVDPSADLAVTKLASVGTAFVGDSFDYDITVTNVGPSDTVDVIIQDVLPPEVTFVSVNSPDFSCSSASLPLVDCLYTGSGLSSGTSTAPINITVQATTAGNPSNTATASAVMTADVNAANDADTAMVTISPVAGGVDMKIDKRALQSSVNGGEALAYLIGVTNSGSSQATGVQVIDTLPEGSVVTSINGSSWSCDQSDQIITCDYLPSIFTGNRSSFITIETLAPNVDGIIVNTASVSSTETDVDTGNNTSSASTLISASDGADLMLTKTVTSSAVAPGQAFDYVLTLTNNGPLDATMVQISDTFPTGFSFDGSSSTGWTCSGTAPSINCTLTGTLASGQTTTLVLQATAGQTEGNFQNQATASAAEPDNDTTNNTASVDVMVASNNANADVALDKSVNLATATQAQALVYTLTASNNGPSDAINVQVLDTLPDGLLLTGVDANGWSCTTTSNAVDCRLMNALAVNDTAEIVLLTSTQISDGNLLNQATITSALPDPFTDNNMASASTSIDGSGNPADMRLTIADSADPVRTESSVDYLINVINDGPGEGQNVSLSATLSAGAVISSISAVNWTCQNQNSSLDCQFNGDFLPSTQSLLTVSVLTPAVSGSITATATVMTQSQDSNPGNNSASESTQVTITSDESSFSERLEDALGDNPDPGVTDNLIAVARLCGSPTDNVTSLCREIDDALDEGRNSEVSNAIVSVIGRQTVTQHTSMTEASSVQFSNINTRMAENRNGATGLSLNGLTLRYADQTLPLAFMQNSDEPVIASSDLVKPWGFFVNGTVSAGEKDPSTREVGFDFDTYGITAGFDYRPSGRSVIGVALGYADFESDYNDGGSLETDGFTLHTFASFYPNERFYIDGRLSYSDYDFEQLRPLNFTIGNLTVDEIARGSTGADQVSAAISFGYNINRNSWNFTPSASISLTDGTIDGFTETGTDLALSYDEQDVESLLLTASFSASRIISLANGVLTPQFSVAYHHESRNDDFDIDSQIIGSAAGTSFFVDSDDPDVNYGTVGIGLVYIMSNGKQAYINYQNTIGLSGFDRWTINGGLRFEF